jgi:hypothetical protein
MIEGILTVNLDPPYCSFHSHETGFSYLRSAECTVEEIRVILIELGAISSSQHWPMQECFVRLTGTFSEVQLTNLGLWPMREHQYAHEHELDQEQFGHRTVA